MERGGHATSLPDLGNRISPSVYAMWRMAACVGSWSRKWKSGGSMPDTTHPSWRKLAQPPIQRERGFCLSIFLVFFCEFSCFFLLFLWFSEHALLVLPVVLLWWEFFSVYFSGFFGEFCWFSASDGLSAAPRVRNRSKSQRATTTHYIQPFVLLQLALGASGRPSLAPTGLKS